MKKSVLGLFTILAALVLSSAPVQAQFEEGVHYQLVDNAPMTAAGPIEVVEAFSYMCTHCNTFEPYISAWIKDLDSNVKFRRIPVVFGRGSWEIYARAYVTADLMGVADTAHGDLMDKLWKKREVMRTMEELGEFYSDFGVAPATFVATSKSFAADAKLRKDQLVVQTAQVKGTPSMVVSGKYLIATNKDVSSYDAMLAVVDFLVAQEQAAQATVVSEASDEAASAETAAND
jgi:thiol:disulfide interchange protein DsbA